MKMPEKLKSFIDSLTDKEAAELYDWFNEEPHSELIVQAHVAQKFPSIMDVPPEFWTLMNPERKDG